MIEGPLERRVVTSELAVHSAPVTGAPFLSTLPPGAEVEVNGRYGGRAWVTADDGTVGWVSFGEED